MYLVQYIVRCLFKQRCAGQLQTMTWIVVDLQCHRVFYCMCCNWFERKSGIALVRLRLTVSLWLLVLL